MSASTSYSRLRGKTTSVSTHVLALITISYCARKSFFIFLIFLTLFGLHQVLYSSDSKWRYYPSTTSSQEVETLNSEPQLLLNLKNLLTESPTLGDYLIHTESCLIPRFPIFSPEILPFYKPANSSTKKDHQCTKISIADEIVRLNATSVYIPPSLEGTCSGKEVIRSQANEGQTFGRAWPVVKSGDDFPQTDALLVECAGDVKKLLPLIPTKKPNKWDKVPTESETPPSGPVNVLLVGIDAVSRLNFLRHMRQTAAFLEAHNFTSLLGHHKVGDNTMPNLFGMFTGLAKKVWWKQLPSSKKLDSLPLIFKRYSNSGYLTTYIEDYPYCGLFTFHGVKGFSGKPPTEYYLRPVNLWLQKKSLYDRNWCTGGQLEMEYYYNYVLDQMTAFRERKQPHLIWIHQSTVSHEEVNLCQWTDGPVVRLLRKIFAQKHSQNTVIIFYSDHAIRIGKILETESGFHETRLPFFYVYVPEELKLRAEDKNILTSADLKSILNENSHRLTSHMDVHATLRHLLTGSPPTDEPLGQSLFTPISGARSCSQAGVPDEYCLCKHFVALSGDQTARAIAGKLVAQFNDQLGPFLSECSQLELDSVVTAKIAYDAVDKGESKAVVSRRKAMVSLVFTVNPSGAKFDATVRTTFTGSKNEQTVDLNLTTVVGKIARNDRYAEQSACVAGSVVETFCYCKENIKRTL